LAELDHEQRVVYLLRRLACYMYTHSRQMVRRCGLTTPQAITLQTLLRSGGLSASELARRVCLSPGTLSGILDRLEANGLIERRRSLDDRRKVMVHLTDSAVEWFDGDLSLLNASFSDRFGALPENEKASILKSLHQLAAMIHDPSDPSSQMRLTEELETVVIPLHELVNHESKASPMRPGDDSIRSASCARGKK
jgi:DNA-binding MarR family transcriptional regulator